MAIKIIDDTILQDIAVSIQSKDGGGKMEATEMAERIDAIPSQDNTVLNSLIDKTIKNLESDVSSVGWGTFSYCNKLHTLILTSATILSNDAVRNCGTLSNVEIPKVNTINSTCFFGDYFLKRIFLRDVTALNGQQIFYNCTRLTTIVMGKRATLGTVNSFNRAAQIIYVQPEDLSWYSTATNWSTLYADNRVKSVEELSGDDLLWYQEQLAKYPIEEAS